MIRKWLLRSIGLILLILLFLLLGPGRVMESLRGASPGWILAAIFLYFPLVGLKTVRWRRLMGADAQGYSTFDASLTYWMGIFFGLFTPARLGELTRAGIAAKDLGCPVSRLMPSVLADRAFDLLALGTIGAAALSSLLPDVKTLPWLFAATVPTVMAVGFLYLKRRFPVTKTIPPKGTSLGNLAAGFAGISIANTLQAILLTVLAYLIFFLQCWLIARAISLPAGLVEVAMAVSLGSLVALLPLSISGLGTREAAIVTFLATSGVAEEQAFAFSLLVFGVFHLAGAGIGAVAWAVRKSRYREGNEGTD